MAQQMTASGFVGTIGVATHIAYTDGEYSDPKLIISDLGYLGIDNVRDGISNGANGSAGIASYIAVAQSGVKFTFLSGAGGAQTTQTLAASIGLVDQVAKAVPGSVVAVEGLNEINNQPITWNGAAAPTGQDELDAALSYQRQLYADVKADPALQGVAVDEFTGAGAGGIPKGPDVGTTPGLADDVTQHPYPNFGQAPAHWVAPSTATPGNTAPAVYTETGYSSNGGTSGGVNADVQARYTLDLLFDDAKDGVTRTYLYDLLDAYAPGSRQGDDGLGLFDYTKAAKPVAVAIHDLTSILADTGSSAPPASVAGSAYSVGGLPATGNSLLLSKSDGSSDIAVWAEPAIWNESTGTETLQPATPVSVSLGAVYASVEVFDPMAGTAPVQTLTDVSTVTLQLGDHPLIVQVAPATAAAARPVLAVQSPDQRIAAGSAFSFSLPPGSYADPNGGTLSYAALALDGSALPGWLQFNAATGTFSGTIPASAGVTGVKITATTSEGAASAEAFHLYSVASPPVLAKQQGDVRAQGGTAVSFSLPAASFSDAAGQTVALSATGEGGAALPSWLNFDAAAGAFHGTAPSSGGTQAVVVTGTAAGGGAAAEEFRIYTSPAAPVLQSQQGDERIQAGSKFSFSLSPAAYSDPAGGTLAYSASQQDGSALPSWVKFDAASDTFSGTVPDTAGSTGIMVQATSSEGGVSREGFRIYATPAAPALAAQAPDQRLAAATAFSFALPQPSFSDPAGGAVALTARSVDLSALPSWLSFNPSTDVFSGTTPGGSGGVGVRVDATTMSGGSAAEAFHLYFGGGSTAADLVSPGH